MFGFAPSLQPALKLWCGTRSGMCVVQRHWIFPLHPICISVRLKKLYKGFHGYFNHVFTTSTLEGWREKKVVFVTWFVHISVYIANFSVQRSHIRQISLQKWKPHTFNEYCGKVYLRCHFAIVYPAYGGKICGFGTVETMIEPSMVTIRKCNDELSSFLSNLWMERERNWVVATFEDHFLRKSKQKQRSYF